MYRKGEMYVQESIAFCLLLFLGLYGIVSILQRVCIWILRPAGGLSFFGVVYLRRETENVEQIIRYFRAKADKNDVLLLVDNGVEEHEKVVINKLCENRRDVRFISVENFVEENCIQGENAI